MALINTIIKISGLQFYNRVSFLICYIDYAITVVPFFLSFIPLCPAPCLPPAFPHLSTYPWIIHTSSLASPFPILLFLTSPVYFVPTIYAFYSLYLFPHSSRSPFPLITLHVISISVILFLFSLFAFCFRFSC